MLAYVFWHRPRRDVDVAVYEEAQRSFHESLEATSACFRLAELPFAARPGYEDWYLVEDWNGLGELSDAAIDAIRRPAHDRAASMAADGWGGVYAAVRGPAAIPDGAVWFEKPPGEPSQEFVASLDHPTVWRRQLVLSPAPEFCGAVPALDTRVRIWPDPQGGR
jgi:hypothetical protein